MNHNETKEQLIAAVATGELESFDARDNYKVLGRGLSSLSESEIIKKGVYSGMTIESTIRIPKPEIDITQRELMAIKALINKDDASWAALADYLAEIFFEE